MPATSPSPIPSEMRDTAVAFRVSWNLLRVDDVGVSARSEFAMISQTRASVYGEIAISRESANAVTVSALAASPRILAGRAISRARLCRSRHRSACPHAIGAAPRDARPRAVSDRPPAPSTLQARGLPLTANGTSRRRNAANPARAVRTITHSPPARRISCQTYVCALLASPASDFSSMPGLMAFMLPADLHLPAISPPPRCCGLGGSHTGRVAVACDHDAGRIDNCQGRHAQPFRRLLHALQARGGQ